MNWYGWTVRRKVSSDDAHVDNKTDLEAPSRSVYLLSWRFEQDTPITVYLVYWKQAEVVAEGLLWVLYLFVPWETKLEELLAMVETQEIA